jgi:anaerobic selenocysteine-containing dehydrogenase
MLKSDGRGSWVVVAMWVSVVVASGVAVGPYVVEAARSTLLVDATNRPLHWPVKFPCPKCGTSCEWDMSTQDGQYKCQNITCGHRAAYDPKPASLLW